MARGYQTEEIKQKLVDVLNDTKTGMSGVEISEKLGVNRITMTKYLNIFAAEGLNPFVLSGDKSEADGPH